MAINFPNSPTLDQTFSSGNNTYIWNGNAWVGYSTVTSSGGTVVSSQWGTVATGIHTLSNVGIGTTNATSLLTVKGNTSLETLTVSGVSTFSGSYLYANNISLSTGNALYVSNSGGSYHQLGGTNQDILLFKSRGVGPISNISINILNDTLGTGGGSDESVFKVYGDGGLRSYYHTISGGFAIQSERFSVTGGDSSGATPSNIIMKVGTGFTAYGNGSVFANQLNVSGVSTFQDYVGIGVTTDPVAYNLDVAGYTRIRDGLIVNGGSTYPAEFTSDIFIYGHNLDITGGGNLTVNGGTTFTNQLNVSGVSTFNDQVDIYSSVSVQGAVGIATTNPQTPLQVESIYGVKTGTGTFTAAVGVAHTIDSFTISQTDFKTAEYTIHVGFGTYIQSQKVLVMQNETTAYSQEYAIMYHPELVVSIGATITGGQLRLQATPESGITGLTTYRFVRQSML